MKNRFFMVYRSGNEKSNPVTIFEFKQPQRDDFTDQSNEEDPIDQILRYAREIKEGKLADLLLINLKRPELYPGHCLISDLVYSANGSCVDTTICDGKILMQNRKVPNEEKILEEARLQAKELVSRE